MQYLVDQKVPFRVLGLADAIYAKTWASTIDKLGLKVCLCLLFTLNYIMLFYPLMRVCFVLMGIKYRNAKERTER